MRIRRAVSWMMIAALALPHGALAAARPQATPQREALPDVALAVAWGGEHPVAKIGYDAKYGFLEIRRPNFQCPVGDFLNTPIVPSIVNAPGCRQSIPTLLRADGQALVLIGGDAANLFSAQSPLFQVFVNAVEVPASELGPDFRKSCSQISGQDGTATTDAGILVKLYACSGLNGESFNIARIPMSRFQNGLNNITVRYGFQEAAFDQNGTDIDTRVVFVTG
jgi:hypothetical protein